MREKNKIARRETKQFELEVLPAREILAQQAAFADIESFLTVYISNYNIARYRAEEKDPEYAVYDGID